MNPRLMVVTSGRGGWFCRADAMAAGYSDSEIRWRVRQGRWTRLCRDAYAEVGVPGDGEPSWERVERVHRLLTRVIVHRLGEGVAVSHQSAAIRFGLPSWGLDLGRVQVTRSTGRARTDRSVRTHRSPLAPGDTRMLEGCRVTSPARAVVEVACSTSYQVGVVVADAALRTRLVGPEDLIATADRFQHWAGSPAARAAVRFADGMSESVGESRLRVLMANQGLPTPRPQVEIHAANGELVGRVDFLLEPRLIVEFDGVQKYGVQPSSALVAEKWREDRLRELGYSFVRIGWADLNRPDQVAYRLRRALSGARFPAA
ncbi:type IV toxin-antitoxin system AbiEi family antitoxin domain-containing protein [Kribbella sp. DT2]|uniref:type IV toxin-antitoxin system AbiEi family antitoxin domain-containing protein n=1 Tax=Kribbella sp. DT2 TaxID=3393427 RepID=UPI003CEA79A9